MDRYKEELEARIKKALPELKESEDERIRKELIGYLTHRAEVTGFIDEDKDCKRWIAYLEKQKEQTSDIILKAFENSKTDYSLEEREEASDYSEKVLPTSIAYEEASIGLNEYDSGLYNGIAGTCMKLRGFIKARLDSNEQPEVDLEKEFEDYLGNMEGQPRMWHPNEQIEWAKDIACHFAEWGAIHLNARKEE